jgi:hypothetical protein
VEHISLGDGLHWKCLHVWGNGCGSAVRVTLEIMELGNLWHFIGTFSGGLRSEIFGISGTDRQRPAQNGGGGGGGLVSEPYAFPLTGYRSSTLIVPQCFQAGRSATSLRKIT